MKNIFLIIFVLSAKLALGQIINGSFEVWDTIGTCSNCNNLLYLFGVPNPTGGIASHWANGTGFIDNGVKRTTDNHTGSYSILLHDWYAGVPGRITYHDTISFRPQFLQGYFKYITTTYDGISHGAATVTLTRFNGLTNDTIATGSYQFDSTSYFIPFQLSLNYLSALIPDSIKIYIINDENVNGCLQNAVCDLLYLDDLMLTNTPMGIENIITTGDLISIYPNPTSNELNIQNNHLQQFQFALYNYLGEKLIDEILTNKANRINLSAYSDGIYFYQVCKDNHLITSGKIIKQ